MCTVTYIPLKDKRFILTSNRDEREYRATIPPTSYEIEDRKLVFPKDKEAGGSWIVYSNKGKVCCLLNGAYVAHKKEEFHTVSRGNILVDFAVSDLPMEEFFNSKDLSKVQPFTIISILHTNGIVDGFFEVIWDGIKRYYRALNAHIPYIWSSVTLYSEEHREMREEWFNHSFAEDTDDELPQKAFEFHSGVHTDDNKVNVVMERTGGLKTLSITQIIPEEDKVHMTYHDLLNSEKYDVLL